MLWYHKDIENISYCVISAINVRRYFMKSQIILISLFIIFETVLCVAVQITTGPLLTAVSFGAVVLAFIFSLITLKNDFNNILTSFGLLTTVVSDIFLVVLNPAIQDVAMLSFSITQILYFIRIHLNTFDNKIKILHIVTRIFTVVLSLLLTIVVLKEKTDFLSLISIFYYANLLTNVVFSFFTKRLFILSIGLICFALCDMFIGLNILSSSYIQLAEGSLLYFLANPSFNFAWLFYVPSQTLIALSCVKFNLKS